MVDMGRIPGYYEWDDDDLTPGNKKEGGLHQNLFDDDGKLKGSARFIPSDPESDSFDTGFVSENVYVPVEERRKSKEQEELEEAIAQLVLVLIVVGIEKAKPHVEHWWRESIRPFVRKQWSKLRRRKPIIEESELAELDPVAMNASPMTSAVQVAGKQDRPKMSSAEAQARMLAAIAAQAFSDEQMRLVNNAELVDAEDAEAIREAIARMPPETLTRLVKGMVTNPSMFEEESLAELASVLASNANQGQRVLKAHHNTSEID